MKYYYHAIIVLVSVLFSQSTFSQEDFATLRKNVNSRASSLHHSLNKTKDTLVLKSPKEISYIYSVNQNYKREIDAYIGKTEHNVPLNNLSKGKHVFVVSHQRMKIVFTVFINKDNELILPSDKKLITSTNKD